MSRTFVCSVQGGVQNLHKYIATKMFRAENRSDELLTNADQNQAVDPPKRNNERNECRIQLSLFLQAACAPNRWASLKGYNGRRAAKMLRNLEIFPRCD
jgi:hypothetical protein